MTATMCKLTGMLLAVLLLMSQIQAKKDKSKNADPKEVKPKASRGIGISAWGLIFVIVCVIMLAIGAYYSIIFYPILCKRERLYDRFELTSI